MKKETRKSGVFVRKLLYMKLGQEGNEGMSENVVKAAIPIKTRTGGVVFFLLFLWSLTS